MELHGQLGHFVTQLSLDSSLMFMNSQDSSFAALLGEFGITFDGKNT